MKPERMKNNRLQKIQGVFLPKLVLQNHVVMRTNRHNQCSGTQ